MSAKFTGKISSKNAHDSDRMRGHPNALPSTTLVHPASSKFSTSVSSCDGGPCDCREECTNVCDLHSARVLRWSQGECTCTNGVDHFNVMC